MTQSRSEPSGAPAIPEPILGIPRAQTGDTLAVMFLRQGGQPAETAAEAIAAFISAARTSLDIAIYDCRLSKGPASLIRQALQGRVKAGVTIRLVFDNSRAKPQTGADLDVSGGDTTPQDTKERVAELGLDDALVRPVHAFRGLMHHKYMVRDDEAVWTGSLNWSDDSMTRMENIALSLSSAKLAALFRRDFEQLWNRGDILESGAFPTDPDLLRFAGTDALTDVDFSPGQGEQINQWVANRVLSARKRIVVCSMLLNSSQLLRALLTQLDRGEVEMWGVYDETQMQGVLHQWRQDGRLAWKIAAVERVIREAKLAGKRSTPYRPDSIHDFMHNKTLVIDDTVVTGSYNLSHAAEGNAENMLAIENQALAALVVAYVTSLAAGFARDGHT
ncbi:MAG: phospholipase D-like domain-containing protein [Thermomicrobiales bacterium]